jgi:hypothetical protein
MGPKREEHSRFKGVCHSTSLAGVNDLGGRRTGDQQIPLPRGSVASL